MPSIIYAAGFKSPYGGNFIASLKVLAACCAGRRWRMVAVFLESARQQPWCRQLIAEGMPVYFVADGASLLRRAWALVKIARRENGVLFHTHFSWVDTAAALASVLLRMSGKRVHVLWHRHSDFGNPASHPLSTHNIIKHRFLAWGARVVVISEDLRKQVIASGIQAGRVSVIHNGIDFDRATRTTRPVSQVREELRLAANEHLLLLFGWSPETKGVDVAIDAANSLVDAGCPALLGIVGQEVLREYLVSRFGTSLPPWVRLIPPAENVADLYQAASIFISASRAEGFSYAVCEAIGNQIPVVLSDIPGLAWARAVPGAVFFPSQDSQALARAVQRVLAWTPGERARIVAENSNVVRSSFDVGAWAQRVMEEYETLLPAPAAQQHNEMSVQRT